MIPEPVGRLSAVLPDQTLRTPGVVDLHCFFYESVTDAALLARYETWMTDEERERHRRFVFERDRALFLATRALVRATLSLYSPVAPEDWRFEDGSHGKPHIVEPTSASSIAFNLTNTHGLVVCAVSCHGSLGVDAENLTRPGETVAIADSYFSPLEVLALRQVKSDDQRERFFAYWTLKESYIKARGLGLAIPLEQFSFLLDQAPPITIRFGPQLDDDAARWQFELFRASSRHLVAVGADCAGAPLVVRASQHVPHVGLLPFGAAA
jgi:4'-phosphopantetheinyl transferase